MKHYQDGFVLMNAKYEGRCNECHIVIDQHMPCLYDKKDKVTYCLDCADEIKPGVYNDAKDLQGGTKSQRHDVS